MNTVNFMSNAEVVKNLDCDDKFAKAIIDMRKIRPFYSAVYETMKKKEVSSVGTIGVSATELVYNREFIDNLEYSELLFILLHEIAHISLMHPLRIRDREHEIYNIACDLYVNKALADEFELRPGMTNKLYNVTMPLDCEYNDYLDIEKKSIEDIYEELIKDKQKKTEGSNSRFKDDIIDTMEDINKVENDIKGVLNEALTRTEMGGNGIEVEFGRLMMDVQQLLKSKLNWKRLVQKYCISFKQQQYSLSSPDRRMYYQDAIYAGKSEDSENILKDIKLCIDTSGSVSKVDLAYFLGQIDDLFKKYKTEAEIVCWDAKVQSTDNVKNVQEIIDKDLCGGGGTRPEVVFNYFESKKCKVKPYLTIVFTDGYFDLDEIVRYRKKYKNTIWIMTKECKSNFTPPFGKVAYADFG
jgi:predicted metal-dependent peptidase